MLLFLCGACGSGKTTVAERLKGHGFTHFDGDAWQNGFDAVEEAGFTATEEHARRAGERPEEMKALGTDMVLAFMALRRGDASFDQGAFDRFYSRMCDDILRARGRCAGPMVATHCAYTRASREVIRARLAGAGVRMVVLEVPSEVVTNRLIGRYVDAAAAKGQSPDEWLRATFAGRETMESLKQKTLAQNTVLPEAVGPQEKGSVSVDASEGVDAVVQSVLGYAV